MTLRISKFDKRPKLKQKVRFSGQVIGEVVSVRELKNGEAKVRVR